MTETLGIAGVRIELTAEQMEQCLQACGQTISALAVGNWVGGSLSRVGPEDETLIPKFRERVFPAHILNYCRQDEVEP